jgi:hypothetical protein
VALNSPTIWHHPFDPLFFFRPLVHRAFPKGSTRSRSAQPAIFIGVLAYLVYQFVFFIFNREDDRETFADADRQVMITRAYRYEIRIEEPLAECRLEWFPNMEITRCADEAEIEGANTILSGWLPDQTALFGVLARIRDLNLTLVSVKRIRSSH